jgi:hypothetical protein
VLRYVIVYYTNKTKLSDEKVALLSTKANLVMNQTRPDIPSLIPNIIRSFETSKAKQNPKPAGDLKRSSTKRPGTTKDMKAMFTRKATKNSMDRSEAAELDTEAWCALYCGGSHKIKDELEASAEKCGIGWEAELFDW